MHLFFQNNLSKKCLIDEEARHCAKVLRFRPRDRVAVTDGAGTEVIAILTSIDSKKCTFEIESERLVPPPAHRINMAVCPTRKAERNEWMVEKMTELGLSELNFVVSEHTHHETINRVVNLDRLNRIALSAMKQSQRYYLPKINVFTSLAAYLDAVDAPERYIAYLADGEEPDHLLHKLKPQLPVSILIGPEGDFSKSEIEAAFAADFAPVSLGAHRLRTETAAVVACHAANLAQIL